VLGVTTVVLFHHAQGLTAGVREFAEALRDGGHEVTAPDLFEGRTFSTVEEGVEFADAIGSAEILRRASVAAELLGEDLVYAGFSLGAFAAQYLAQTRATARGALLYHGGVPVQAFSAPWPAGLRAQVHVARDDPWCPQDEYGPFVEASGAELFLYAGSAHLFTDSSLDAYDKVAADQVMARTLDFLQRPGPSQDLA
jgi:dienelactone hydrolase